jgi:hypothetical protein
MKQSPKMSSPQKKGIMQSLSSIWIKQFSNAGLQSKLHSMHASNETPPKKISQFVPTLGRKGNFGKKYIEIGYPIKIFFWWKHCI